MSVIYITILPTSTREVPMNATMRLTAWICIFSTALLGCTSTTLYKPDGENQEKLHSGEIESVVTKDGTKYEFEGAKKGTLDAGMVRGISGGKAVAIPLSDVDKMLVRESNTVLTVLLVGVGAVAVVAAIVALSGGSKSTGSGSSSSSGY
jgi:hypothetical protein